MALDESLFQDISDAVVAMDEERVVDLVQRVIENGIDVYAAIEKGLSHGMERAGQLFEEEEYFVPELLICSDAMYAGLDLLRPHLKRSDEGSKHKVVIGVIEGDTHDIGKNLVKIMLETAGFELHDLGRDVPAPRFVEKAREVDADIIAISTLMTTTMDGMAEVIRLLNEADLRDRFKVIVGGGPISQGFADRIGANGYAANAGTAVKLARRLLDGETVHAG
ncbi:MAG: Methionine synthase [Syntrophorhabdaceae bacterium PtaU1.Bin034]|jgi:corrinoid protein of di/trimethylamine methyltransferase|nr:MAG: Methionine synthase [Syntrophorhabdaceae bacterium PtaU1.Bin034]